MSIIRNIWARLWCGLRGHGGVESLDGSGYLGPGVRVRCKRCGAITR